MKKTLAYAACCLSLAAATGTASAQSSEPSMDLGRFEYESNCASCHGKAFDGGNNVPRVAHQREDYTLKALRDYRSGKRIGYGNAQMPETVAGLDEAQLADLAHFLAFLRP